MPFWNFRQLPDCLLCVTRLETPVEAPDLLYHAKHFKLPFIIRFACVDLWAVHCKKHIFLNNVLLDLEIYLANRLIRSTFYVVSLNLLEEAARCKDEFLGILDSISLEKSPWITIHNTITRFYSGVSGNLLPILHSVNGQKGPFVYDAKF